MDIPGIITYAQRRLMGNQNIRTGRNLTELLLVCTRQLIAYEHGCSIKMQASYLDARVTQIMDMLWEPFQLGLIKTIIMVSGNEYFMRIGKFGQPFNKVNDFLLRARRGKIPRMNQHICIGQGAKLPMQAVRVRKMQ